MGLISNQVQDNRPRDWAYMVRFDKKDLPSLEEMARHIRETHDTDMIEDFNRKCEERLAGNKATLENGIEIQSVTRTGDLIVNAGIDQCIRLIQGTSTNRWSHFGMSSGSNPAPAITDTALLVETVASRVTLAWNEAVGMRLYFGGISSQTETGSLAPGAVGEIGVYNGSAAGAILLNRTLFGFLQTLQQQAPTISPEIKSSPIVVSSVIVFCPVA